MMTSEALDIESYWEGLRPTRTPSEAREVLTKYPDASDSVLRQGEFEVTFGGVRYRGYLTGIERMVEQEPAYYRNGAVGLGGPRISYRGEVQLIPEIRMSWDRLTLGGAPVPNITHQVATQSERR